MGLYEDAIDSAKRSNQLYGKDRPYILYLIAMAEHRMGNANAAEQIFLETNSLVAKDNSWGRDSFTLQLRAEAGEVLKQQPEPWDEVTVWEKCRQSLLDLELDPQKVAAWETQSVARYAERHKNDQNNPWLARATTLLDQQITVIEKKLQKDLDNADAARELLQLVLQRYSTTLNYILPTAETSANEWSYTTTAPPADWVKKNFDQSTWKTGKAGFGKLYARELVVRTEWNTSDIWLRNSFQWQPSNPQNPLLLRIIHDNAVEIFLNEKKIVNRGNSISNYIELPLNPQALQAGENIIAIHCIRTTALNISMSELRKSKANR